MQFIEGGVCAPKGFKAAGVHCGVRKNKLKKDLALIVSDVPATAAAIYTQNLVKGAPITVTRAHLQDGIARAIICNSGNANTCNPGGVELAEKMCALVETYTSVPAGDVIIASTGVIGQPLPIEPIEAGVPLLAEALSCEGGADAAEAIMTTDTVRKEAAAEFSVGGVTCRLGGMAKGSGMIHPNMATLLSFVTCDAKVESSSLQRALKAAADVSYNMVSIDGDTSTNDTLAILCNGASGAHELSEGVDGWDEFTCALTAVLIKLSRMIAKDGEGATKLICCNVSGAKDYNTARVAAKSVICSSLTKSALFGADANWGRVLCALGYGGAELDVSQIGVTFASRAGEVEVCRGGLGVPFSEELAKRVLSEDEIDVNVTAGEGEGTAAAWGCDLTYDYVKINGDYRT